MEKELENQEQETRDKFKTKEKTPKKAKSKDPCKEELQKQKDLVKELESQTKYLQADMDNLRKYYAKQWRDKVEVANEDLLEDLLPTLDNLEIASLQITDQPTKQGIDLILKEFKKILGKYGITPIKTIGEKFDPQLHEVIRKEHSDLVEETIIEEFQRGYLLKKKVLRFSKVKSSGGPKNG